MKNPVNFDKDIPSSDKQKEAIFYEGGLKIYGTLPYILHRKLKAEFVSSRFEHEENNFTIVLYAQKPENVQALVNWLYKDAGFVWAISREPLNPRVSDRLPETETPDRTFQATVSQMFGVAVQTPESNAPKPWDAVLGGIGKRPKPGDAVLGGSLDNRDSE